MDIFEVKNLLMSNLNADITTKNGPTLIQFYKMWTWRLVSNIYKNQLPSWSKKKVLKTPLRKEKNNCGHIPTLDFSQQLQPLSPPQTFKSKTQRPSPGWCNRNEWLRRSRIAEDNPDTNVCNQRKDPYTT